MKITIIDTAAYIDTPYNKDFVSQDRKSTRLNSSH